MMNPSEQGYYNRIIAGNINQVLKVDSVVVNFTNYPYDGKHQGLAIVEDIDFLALLFGEVQRKHHGGDSHHSTETHEDNSTSIRC